MATSTHSSSLECWICLARAPGIGPRLASALLQHFKNPENVFDASERELLQVPGLGAGRTQALRSQSLLHQARRDIERARRSGFRFLTLADAEYPAPLRALASPPPVLSVRGDLKSLDALALTVVGPRVPSDYARRMVRRLVPPLMARGLTVISGLAQGIDAEAHKAAMDSGGRTIAVLGQGLDTSLYPSSNLTLAERIVREEQGAILSPFPIDEKPQAGLFPRRNELLAALGLGLLIVEAAERSGALITARHALDFGRTVMAIPGDAERPTARGSNRLLADGAVLVQTADDVLEALVSELREAVDALEGERQAAGESTILSARDTRTHDTGPSVPPPRGFPSDALARRIGDLLEEEHRPLDFILQHCADAGFGHGAVIQRLLELEMNGVLTQLPGRVYSRRT